VQHKQGFVILFPLWMLSSRIGLLLFKFPHELLWHPSASHFYYWFYLLLGTEIFVETCGFILRGPLWTKALGFEYSFHLHYSVFKCKGQLTLHAQYHSCEIKWIMCSVATGIALMSNCVWRLITYCFIFLT